MKKGLNILPRGGLGVKKGVKNGGLGGVWEGSGGRDRHGFISVFRLNFDMGGVWEGI